MRVLSLVCVLLLAVSSFASPVHDHLYNSMVAMSQIRGASYTELEQLHGHVQKLAAGNFHAQANDPALLACEAIPGMTATCCQTLVTAAETATQQCAAAAQLLGTTLSTMHAASNFVATTCVALNAVNTCLNSYSAILTSVSSCVPSGAATLIDGVLGTVIGTTLNSELNAVQTITGVLSGALCKPDPANPGTYCLANLLNTTAVSTLVTDLQNNNIKQFFTDLQNDTPFFLATCSSCVKDVLAIVNAFPSFGNPYIAIISVALNGLELVCQQDPSNPANSCLANLEALLPYLFPKELGTTTTTVSATATPAPISATVKAAICSPCTQSLVQIAEQLFPQAATEIAAFSKLAFSLCQTDRAGNQCFTVLSNAAQNFVNQAQNGQLNSCIQQLTAATPVCNSTCAALINTDLFQPLGCCLGTLGLNSFSQAFQLGFVSVSGANLPGFALQTVASAAAAQCQFQLPAQCAGFVNITVQLNIPNLNFAFAISGNNWATIAQKLAADVSQALGVPASAVTVSAPTAFGGTGVSVTVQVSLTPASANAIAQALATKLQNQKFPLPQTASYCHTNTAATNSQTDAVLAVSGSVTGGGSSSSSTSSAGALKASFFSFAALFATFYALLL